MKKNYQPDMCHKYTMQTLKQCEISATYKRCSLYVAQSYAGSNTV